MFRKNCSVRSSLRTCGHPRFDSAGRSRCGQSVRYAAALAAVFSLVASGSYAAQLEEVVVTARKQQESAQDVPVAIEAFSSEDIERYQSSDLTQIAELATQVIVNPTASGNGGGINIRGIGAPTLDPGIESSVTINIDGMQVDRGHVTRQAMFDLDSVQILKGPQVLFFGKNSPAGVVALTAALPSFEETEVRAMVGNEFEADEVIGEFLVSGPLTENLAARFAYRGSSMDGFLDNRAGSIDAATIAADFPTEPFALPGATRDPFGGDESHAGRLTLRWQPTDSFEGILRVLGTSYETDGYAMQEITNCSGDEPITRNLLSGAPIVDPFGDCKLDGRISHGSIPREVAAAYPGARSDGSPFGEYDSWLGTLNLEWNLDSFVINSTTGYYTYDYVRFDNFDGTVYSALMGMQMEDQTSLTQELRVRSTFSGPLNFTAGAFFEDTQRDSDNRGKIFPLADPTTGNRNNWEGNSTVDVRSWSVFFQGTWDITDRLELAAGARYTDEDREAVQGNPYVNDIFDGVVFLSEGTFLNSTFEDTDLSPEVTLTWRPSDEVTLFGAYRTGYKAGGFATNTVIPPGTTAEDVVFDPEEAEGFEVGVKSLLADGTLRLNATAYYYEFDNLQVSAFDAATTSFNIINAASSTTLGLEADATWLLSDIISLRGSIGYNEGDFDEFPGAPCWTGQSEAEGCVGGVQDLSGNRRPAAPLWNTNFGMDLENTIGGTGWSYALSFDAVWQDEISTQTADNPFAEQDAFWRLHARAMLFSSDGTWEVSLIGRNLTNEWYVFGTADKPGGTRGDVFGTVLRPRQVLLQATWNFNR